MQNWQGQHRSRRFGEPPLLGWGRLGTSRGPNQGDRRSSRSYQEVRLVILRLAVFIVALGTASVAFAQTRPATPATDMVFQDQGTADNKLTLKEALEKGLKARRPEEFEFIDRVVYLVEEGILPKRLVQSTFFWARQQPRIPAVYFEWALRVRAQRLGILI